MLNLSSSVELLGNEGFRIGGAVLNGPEFVHPQRILHRVNRFNDSSQLFNDIRVGSVAEEGVGVAQFYCFLV